MLQGFDFQNDHWDKMILFLVKGKGKGTVIVIDKKQQMQIRSAISFIDHKKEGDQRDKIWQNLNKKNLQT